MAMEHHPQDSVANKEDDASLNKWKSSSESVDESANCPSGGFDCNICLETVHDPVVTLCGHLYCWPCIYKWIHHQKTTPEHIDKKIAQCPVCKSEISKNTLVPLYGRGKPEPLSEQKGLNPGITIPRRPPSPRCNVTTVPVPVPVPAQQANYRTYQHQPMPIAMHGLSGVMTNMISPTSPTTGMIGEIMYEIFGNSHSTLFEYPNPYNLVGASTPRAIRQAMQAERSLSRVCFFLLCCVMLCLLLF